MVSVENNTILVFCLESVKAHFKSKYKIIIFKFDSVTSRRCCYHLDIEGNEGMARQMISRFKKLRSKELLTSK